MPAAAFCGGGARGCEYWPLKSHADGHKGLRGRVLAFREQWRSWWELTTSSSYLTCAVSRRGLRRVSLPAFALWNLLGDIACQAVPLLYVDPLVFLLLCVLAHVPARVMWGDLLAVGAALAHSVTRLTSPELVAGGLPASTFVTLATYWILSLAMLGGVHPVFLLSYVALLSSGLAFALGAVECLLGFLLGFAVVVMLGVMDARVGSLWEDFDRQKESTNQLLCGLSDGFCTLDAGSGVIGAASARLEEAFEAPHLEGRSVFELLRLPTDRSHLEEMLAHARCNGAARSPRLLACQTLSGDTLFDAMFVPYAATRRELSFGVRIVGEKRSAVSRVEDMCLASTMDPTSAAASITSLVPLQRRGLQARAVNKKAIGGEVPFALSWADDAVQAALLAPRPTAAKLRSNVAVQTEDGAAGTMSSLMVSHLAPAAGGAGPAPPPQQGLQAAGLPLPQPGQPSQALAAPEALQTLPLPPGFRNRTRSAGSRRSRRSMSSGTGRTASESSFGSSAGALGRPSMASMFMDTALLTRRKSIIIAMHHWNLPRNPDACCPWHTAVYAVEEVARLEARTPCKPLWSPFLGWQCTTCTCVNHPTVAPCNVCGAERPSMDQAFHHAPPPMTQPPQTPAFEPAAA